MVKTLKNRLCRDINPYDAPTGIRTGLITDVAHSATRSAGSNLNTMKSSQVTGVSLWLMRLRVLLP